MKKKISISINFLLKALKAHKFQKNYINKEKVIDQMISSVYGNGAAIQLKKDLYASVLNTGICRSFLKVNFYLVFFCMRLLVIFNHQYIF